MDIFEHLRQDHRKVSDLMARLASSGDDGERERLFAELRGEILRHARAEERTFYAFLEQHEDIEDLIAEAREDHQMVETILSELEAMTPGSDDWRGRLEELKEAIEDHVDQEETEIFEEARDVMSEQQASELEQRLASEEERRAPM